MGPAVSIYGGLFMMSFAFIAILLALGSLAFTIWMLVDCIGRDEKNFNDRTLWLVLLVIGIFSGYGFVLSLVYFFAIRKNLK